ncbi:hypothetical protein GGS26DRAFT_604088 [Hypomontagnella submonticulosa]|nr:hypothetical protein GGS26DRAFT_604088 [Hypomontagnella submonticulosa]
MSLHRWSLPSRALAHEKSNDSNSGNQGSYFTIHIGNPLSRKRPDLSSAFASFEKDENRPQATAAESNQFAPDDPRPLSTRVENVPSPAKSKHAKPDVGFHRSDTPIQPHERKGEIWLQQKHETLKKSRTCGILDDGDKHARSPDGDSPDGFRSSMSLTRVRSASSSYPSEGIRSPPEHCRSPQLNTWSENFVSELSRYGTYPSQETSSKSSGSISDISGMRDGVRQCLMEELAAAGDISDTETRTTSGEYPSKPPLSDIASMRSLEEERDNPFMVGHDHGFTIGTMQEVHSSTSSRDHSQPMIYGKSSSTSAIHGSVPDPRSSIRVSSSEDDTLFRLSHTGSTDRLRISIDSHAIYPSKIHRKSQDKPYNTMPASLSRKGHPPTTVTSPFEDQKVSGVHFRNSNGSSTTLVQRIQKFKFRRWMKKVCLRTKVRFDNAIKPEASVRSPSQEKTKSKKPRSSKKHRRAKKSKGKPKKVSWKSPRVAKQVKRPFKKQEGVVYRFIRSLKTRKSIQFPVQEKADNNHRRTQSCPA